MLNTEIRNNIEKDKREYNDEQLRNNLSQSSDVFLWKMAIQYR
jgi:hypothetical protein